MYNSQSEVPKKGLSRRDFLKGTVAAGMSVPLLGGLSDASRSITRPNVTRKAAPLQTVRWISPRGTLDVMDDYPLHTAIQMGYFKDLGINAELFAGPISDALACTTFVAENKADIGFPSPGVLTASLNEGVPVQAVFCMDSGQDFDWAMPLNSPITNVKQLAGKTIALGSEGWSTICNPLLAEAGVDPSTVTYIEAGTEWGQITAAGKADACLSWEGLRAEWDALGLKLKYILGTSFSNMDGNIYSVRSADLKDPTWVDLYIRFFEATIMGLAFAVANRRAAAQITYDALPQLRQTLKPEEAYNSFLQNAVVFCQSHLHGQPYAVFNTAAWTSYLKTVYKLGQTKTSLPVGEVVTNSLVLTANRECNLAKAASDARAFKLNSTWSAINPENSIRI